MKVEELPAMCRNILAVSESYICYSVTQKKNLLRVIDTQLGDKVILRGHEHAVLDLKFAAVDAGLLCSVDSGGSDEVSGKPHVIVWKKHEQAEWKVFAELPVRASLVRPHPTQAHVWAVAHEGKVAVFSSQRSAAAQQSVSVASYEALPMHISLPNGEVVKGACSACIVCCSCSPAHHLITMPHRSFNFPHRYGVLIQRTAPSGSRAAGTGCWVCLQPAGV